MVAADAVPADLTLIPGVEINALVTRDLGLWEGELHILGLRHGSGRRRRSRRRWPRQRDQRRLRFQRTVDRLRDIGLPIDAQVADLIHGDDDALGRPTIARALMAAGYADERRGRLQPAHRPRHARLRRARGPRPDGCDRGHPRRPAGSRSSPTSARPRPAPIVLAELVDAGLAGLEVYYRSFDRATTDAVGDGRVGLGLLATGGTDYHGDSGRYAECARPAVGPARGRRGAGGRRSPAPVRPRSPVRP